MGLCTKENFKKVPNMAMEYINGLISLCIRGNGRIMSLMEMANMFGLTAASILDVGK